jgi:hypothetical protein
MVRTMRLRFAAAFAVVTLAGEGPHLPAFSQHAPAVTVLNLKLVCDTEQCRTPVLEVHELTGAEESAPARHHVRRCTHHRRGGRRSRRRPLCARTRRPALAQMQVACQGGELRRRWLRKGLLLDWNKEVALSTGMGTPILDQSLPQAGNWQTRHLRRRYCPLR